jgi:hypothetical protein
MFVAKLPGSDVCVRGDEGRSEKGEEAERADAPECALTAGSGGIDALGLGHSH